MPNDPDAKLDYLAHRTLPMQDTIPAENIIMGASWPSDPRGPNTFLIGETQIIAPHL